MELSCHGGSATWPAVWWKPVLLPVLSLPRPASTPAARSQGGKLGLTQAEAVMDASRQTGDGGAALANAALGGALAKRSVPEGSAYRHFRLTLPHGWIFPKRMSCRSWTVTISTAY